MTKPARGTEKLPGELVDGFNRRINYLRISVTDRCNLRCCYCMPLQGVDLLSSDQVLNYEELLRIARLAVAGGISKIRVTGGEPLVRKGLVEFISRLSEMEGVRDLGLTTNGLLLEEYARRLHKAGLRRVNVSLDSLRPGRYAQITRQGSLEKVFAGIHAARAAGLDPLKINMVVIRGLNHDEVLDFATLAREEELQVRFIEFMPVGEDEFWSRDKYMPSEEVKSLVEAKERLIPIDGKSGGPAVMFRFQEGKGRIGFISPISRHFCGSCDRLRITADGKLRTCLFSDVEIDLKTPLRRGISDEELFNLLHHGTAAKPQGHSLSSTPHNANRYMSQIGG